MIVAVHTCMWNSCERVCLTVERCLMVKVNQGQSLVPFLGCLSTRSSPDSTPMMHAWDLFLKYYETKVCLSYDFISALHIQYHPVICIFETKDKMTIETPRFTRSHLTIIFQVYRLDSLSSPRKPVDVELLFLLPMRALEQ